MNGARYSIIRCSPDLARGELFNIGILIWDDNKYWVVVDHCAIRRAEIANPESACSLDGLAGFVETRIGRLIPFHEKIQHFIDNQRGYPFVLSAPLHISADHMAAMDDALVPIAAELMKRLVVVSGSNLDARPLVDESFRAMRAGLRYIDEGLPQDRAMRADAREKLATAIVHAEVWLEATK